MTKPATAEEYRREGNLEAVCATCLYVATKLGDFADEFVVVGGLVPPLLIDLGRCSQNGDQVESHPGTIDLDVGLSLGLLQEERYRALSEALRRAGFVQDINDDRNPTRQRWKIKGPKNVTIDFLIPPSEPEDKGGTIRHIERDFAAVITPGLHLAFRDRQQVHLSGLTIRGERATRTVWVCGPGAYIVLKALAFVGRGENKDAYDLYYVLRNYGSGVEEVADHLRTLLDDAHAIRALDILRCNFLDHGGVGPQRVAEFATGGPDDEIQADVVGFVGRLLRQVGG